MILRLLVTLLSIASVAAQEFVHLPPGLIRDIRVDRGFWMGRTEVTVDQFAEFIKATGYTTSAERTNSSRTWR